MNEIIAEFLDGATVMVQEVVEDVLNDSDDTDLEVIKLWLENVVQHGCSSGVVGSMVYYEDTVKFFETYANDINDILAYDLSTTGLNIDELLHNWNTADPLAREVHNQNLLAWYAYESVCRDLLIFIENNR